MIPTTQAEYGRALRRAAADLESALIAVQQAVDSEGRRVRLLPPIHSGYTAEALLGSLRKLVGSNGDVPVGGTEVVERLALNVELLVKAWRAALHYESLKPQEPS